MGACSVWHGHSTNIGMHQVRIASSINGLLRTLSRTDLITPLTLKTILQFHFMGHIDDMAIARSKQLKTGHGK